MNHAEPEGLTAFSPRLNRVAGIVAGLQSDFVFLLPIDDMNDREVWMAAADPCHEDSSDNPSGDATYRRPGNRVGVMSRS